MHGAYRRWIALLWVEVAATVGARWLDRLLAATAPELVRHRRGGSSRDWAAFWSMHLGLRSIRQHGLGDRVRARRFGAARARRRRRRTGRPRRRASPRTRAARLDGRRCLRRRRRKRRARCPLAAWPRRSECAWLRSPESHRPQQAAMRRSSSCRPEPVAPYRYPPPLEDVDAARSVTVALKTWQSSPTPATRATGKSATYWRQGLAFVDVHLTSASRGRGQCRMALT